jgi:hypothetical protein
MKNELKTYREKPAHLNIHATDFFNMRITPDRKEAIKQVAIDEGVSMTVVGLSAIDALIALRR